MNVQIKVPTTGFVPGQYIEAILDLTNNSNINVEKVSANLEQVRVCRYKDMYILSNY